MLAHTRKKGQGAALYRVTEACIRRFKAEDAPKLLEAVQESVAELMFWMSWCHRDYSLIDAITFVKTQRESWERRERFDFAIYQPANGEVLGSIGLSHLNWHNGCANVGYWIRTKQTNRGFGRTAIGLVKRFAFDELRLNRLEFLIEAGNVNSLRAAKGAGAQEEGVLRKRLAVRGEVRDAIVLSVVRE